MMKKTQHNIASTEKQLPTRAEIRQLVRNQRKALSISTQQCCANTLANRLKKRVATLIKQTKLNKSCPLSPINIALYIANDGELDPQVFINWCWENYASNNIHVYLPVVHPFSPGNLLFLRYSSNTPMIKNKYGIPEPKLNILEMCTANNLHILFTPLVAFDKSGNRLGMGGGFYDRTLSNINHITPNVVQEQSLLKSTQIIGLAHTCQEVDQLPIEAWDIPLPEIMTPEKNIFPI